MSSPARRERNRQRQIPRGVSSCFPPAVAIPLRPAFRRRIIRQLLEALVEAVEIGKGKRDLTGFVLRPSKPNHGLPRFTIIDTTLVQGQEPFTVREQRRLPADAKVSSVPSCQSRKVVNVSSSKSQMLMVDCMTRKIVDKIQLMLTTLKPFQCSM
ncbi:hypothetical protein ZWY2020_001428 [Hordeum vulgare]|nr:hypothetical protein ZWY2020_001428 [Hordeum vulgare]